jgi:hypothetical protein
VGKPTDSASKKFLEIDRMHKPVLQDFFSYKKPFIPCFQTCVIAFFFFANKSQIKTFPCFFFQFGIKNYVT